MERPEPFPRSSVRLNRANAVRIAQVVNVRSSLTPLAPVTEQSKPAKIATAHLLAIARVAAVVVRVHRLSQGKIPATAAAPAEARRVHRRRVVQPHADDAAAGVPPIARPKHIGSVAASTPSPLPFAVVVHEHADDGPRHATGYALQEPEHVRPRREITLRDTREIETNRVAVTRAFSSDVFVFVFVFVPVAPSVAASTAVSAAYAASPPLSSLSSSSSSAFPSACTPRAALTKACTRSLPGEAGARRRRRGQGAPPSVGPMNPATPWPHIEPGERISPPSRSRTRARSGGNRSPAMEYTSGSAPHRDARGVWPANSASTPSRRW